MAKSKYLKLLIHGLFQHWPDESNMRDGFYVRKKPCGLKPTKQALYGMIECAFGYTNEYEEEKAALEKSIDFSYISEIPPEATFFQDFTTATPLFDEKDYTYSLTNPLTENEFSYFTTAKGSKRDFIPTTRTDYIVGAKYEVHVVGDEEVLEQVMHALDFPKFPYYFGNRKCLPCERVVQGIFEMED